MGTYMYMYLMVNGYGMYKYMYTSLYIHVHVVLHVFPGVRGSYGTPEGVRLATLAAKTP